MTHTEITVPTPILPAFANLHAMVEDEIQWILLEGRLDSTGVEEVRDPFQSAAMACSRHVIVDISGLTFIASTGARLLVSVAKEMAIEGRILVLLKPQPMVDGYLKAAEIHRLIPVAYSENEAALFLAD